MEKLPFSVYDFFSYLTAGYVVLAGVDFALRDGAALGDAPALPLALLAVLGAYVVGQIVAQLAGVALERSALRIIDPPEETLFADEPAQGARARRPESLYRPLEQATRDRVIARAREAGFPLGGGAPARLGSKALWKHCFVRVRGDAPTAARLAAFSYLADFARNVALAALLSAVAIVAGIITGRAGAGPGWWLAVALVAVGGLFFRYLRFRRLFHAEAYIAYAELPDPPPAPVVVATMPTSAFRSPG
jgi:hypothetical protein